MPPPCLRDGGTLTQPCKCNYTGPMARGPTLKPPPWECDSGLVWQPPTAAESQSGHLRHLKVKCFHGKFEDPSSSLYCEHRSSLRQGDREDSFSFSKIAGLVTRCHQMSQHQSMLELPVWRIKARHRAHSGHGVQICSTSRSNSESEQLTFLTKLESAKNQIYTEIASGWLICSFCHVNPKSGLILDGNKNILTFDQ